MDYKQVLITAAGLLDGRGKEYGNADINFSRIANIASVILGRKVTRYEIAIILMATKLGRMSENNRKEDNYVDGVNYLAFAAHFAEDEG